MRRDADEISRRSLLAGAGASAGGGMLGAAAPMPHRAKATAAQQADAIVLSPPQIKGGKPLMEALALRRSTRAFSDRPLSREILSNLLWAAFGINRPSGDRTAPCWRHLMVIDIYATMSDGAWLYDPKQHALMRQVRDDIRHETGLQDFVAGAPLNLVYVAHGERMQDVSPQDRRLYASVDAGFIGQNVYLFCASEGLASVFRGAVEQARLGRALRLGADQFVTFAQTVGYPA